MTDLTLDLVSRVAEALDNKRPLSIRAGNTKRAILGRQVAGEPLDLSSHRGIVDFEPSELVITARSGTPLSEIAEALKVEGLMLGFEPPHFDGRATLGGTLACNLCGPARPWQGSIRDAVLGVQLVNGGAKLLSFGGKVMKNVAGYDVSRLQAGAMGTLGVLTQISLKVIPRPEMTATRSYELSAEDAVKLMNERAGQPKPLTGAFWVDGVLYLRLAGAEAAVNHTAQSWGGEAVADADGIWAKLTEFALPFFSGDNPVWRCSQRSSAPPDPELGETLIDWAGAQRWYRSALDKGRFEQAASQHGGHSMLFRGGDREGEVRHPLSPPEQALQLRLKQSFDPAGVLNPGRLYSWM